MNRQYAWGSTMALLACCLSAACTDPPPSDEEVLERAALMVQAQPGLYRTTSMLASYDLPDANAEDAARLRRMAGLLQPNVTTACLTPEEAARGWMPLIEQLQEGDCTMRRFDVTDGALDAGILCELPGGVSSNIVLTGLGTSTASQMQVVIEQHGDSIPGGMQRLVMEIESERLGDCEQSATE